MAFGSRNEPINLSELSFLVPLKTATHGSLTGGWGAVKIRDNWCRAFSTCLGEQVCLTNGNHDSTYCYG